MWLFLAIMLAQAPPHWVRFEVCQIDFETIPPTLARARDHSVFHVRADHVVGVGLIRRDSQGLECAEIFTLGNRHVYVVGAPQAVMRKLDQKD